MDLAGAIYFMLLTSLIANYATVVVVFQMDRALFLREHANQMYNVLPYFVSKNLIEFPITLILPMLQLLMSYFAIGFNPGFNHFM